MQHLLEMAHHSQPSEHRLDEYTVLPFGPPTQLQVGRIAFGGVESGVVQDDHAFVTLPHQPLECVMRNTCCDTVPPHPQPVLVHSPQMVIVALYPSDQVMAFEIEGGIVTGH
jgi:hypothetical protein